MSGMKDLLGDQMYESRYPSSPGWKEPTTSREAAIKITSRAATLRDNVLCAVRAAGQRGLTADEAATILNETPFAVRPRFTELGPKHGRKIKPNGQRRANESGASAIVWVAVPSINLENEL